MFSRLLAGNASSGYRIAPYPVPNTTVTLAIGLLDLATSPETSGKLIVTTKASAVIADAAPGATLYVRVAVVRA